MAASAVRFCEECGAPVSGDEAAVCATCRLAEAAALPESGATAPAVRRRGPDWVVVVGGLSIVAGLVLMAIQSEYAQSQPSVVQRQFAAPLPAQLSPQLREAARLQAAREAAAQEAEVPLPPVYTPAHGVPQATSQPAPKSRQRTEAERQALFREVARIRWDARQQALAEAAATVYEWRLGTEQVLLSSMLLPVGEDARGKTDYVRLPAGAAVRLHKRQETLTGFRCLVSAGDSEPAWVDGWSLQMALEGVGASSPLLVFVDRQKELERQAWVPVCQREHLDDAALEVLFREGVVLGWDMGLGSALPSGSPEGSE